MTRFTSSPDAKGAPHNRRILVIEDEVMIAMLLEETLENAGYVVVGPYGRLADAMRAAESAEFDLALLDVNLAGEKVFPAADMIEARGLPFLLLTGYGDKAVPEDRPGWRFVEKPFKESELLVALSRLTAAAALPR